MSPSEPPEDPATETIERASGHNRCRSALGFASGSTRAALRLFSADPRRSSPGDPATRHAAPERRKHDVRTISTSIDIGASPMTVWEALVDLDRYPPWNPFILEASGTVAAGETRTLRMFPLDGKPMTFRPRVLAAEVGARLRWIGRFVAPASSTASTSSSSPPRRLARGRMAGQVRR
ncbi:SRPBCC domain-containing protein [Streptodolium elevatio]|uniref:SRPBCC domain-containing protein n=1 Tax=Streptodolium elevatio TaxID=3157996 RepID=A0ABV3DQ90_9ACTN